MSGKLPRGWSNTTLGEICSKPQYGWTCRAVKKGRIKYVRTTDISDGEINWSNVPYCEEAPEDIEKYRVKSNDILVSRAGSVGVSLRVKEVPCEAVFASYLIRFKALDSIDAKYIEAYLKSYDYWRSISDFTAGIAIPNVNASKLASLEFPLAPFKEQRRIVLKLEKLLDKVNASQKRLGKIPVVIKNFRQSVIAAACSGRLTADWREKSDGTSYKSDNGNAVELPEIPDTWTWIKLSKTGEMSRGKSRHRPRNEPSLFGGPYPFIQTGDIAQSGGRITSHKQTYSKVGLAQSRLWPKGSICITIAANIAESAILTYPASFPDSVVGIIVNPNICIAEYIEYFIRVAKADLTMFAPATAQKNINIAILNEVSVPLPPLSEQQEIVRRVKSLLKLANQIETRYAKAQTQVDKLTQSILAKAFRGEFVPQDPNDEPASKLLEQIKAKKK